MHKLTFPTESNLEAQNPLLETSCNAEMVQFEELVCSSWADVLYVPT